MKAWTYIIAATVCVALSVTFLTTPAPSTAQDAAAGAQATSAIVAVDTVPLSFGYDGPGELFVLDDGRVIVTESGLGGQDLGIQIEASSPIYLGHAGNEFFVVSDIVNAANKAVRAMQPVLRIPLVSDPTTCAKAVLQITGHVQITQDAGGQWTLLTQDASKQTFGLTFDMVISENVNASLSAAQCNATCPGGSCSCSGFHACWCFCGLFGEPHCIGFFPANVVISPM